MEEVFTEETLAKARTAKIYIEHLYKVQSQNVKERRDRQGRLGWVGGVWHWEVVTM